MFEPENIFDAISFILLQLKSRYLRYCKLVSESFINTSIEMYDKSKYSSALGPENASVLKLDKLFLRKCSASDLFNIIC